MSLAEVYPLVTARALGRPFTYVVPDDVERGDVLSVQLGNRRVRGLVVALASLVAGTGAGLLLALLVTRVVTVTARAGAAEPPLATVFDLRILLAGAAGFLLASWLFLVLATRRLTTDVATRAGERR